MSHTGLIIYVLCFFTLIELLPFIITIIFPSLCYGCTDIGKLHQEMNNKFGFSYFNFFLMVILFFYIIYLTIVSKRIKSLLLKGVIIALCVLIIYLPVLPLMNLLSLFLCLVFKNPPFIKNYYDEFPAAKIIETGSDKIISEYNTYINNFEAGCINKSNPGFRIETRASAGCWRSIYIKRAGIFCSDIASHFPETIKLLEDKQIHNVLFSILDPGVEIPPHVGYYKGYLRYHLGVEIPNDDSYDDSQKAFIVCGDQKYIWKMKKGVVFDDMYLHYVKNPSNKRRVVLYIDVIRKSTNPLINLVNDAGIAYIETSPIIKLFLKNQHQQQSIN